MLPLFQENFILGETTSSHFFEITTSTQQLLFRDSSFFRTTIFSPFSEQSLFRRSFWIKISKKELIFQSRYFCTLSTFSEKIDFSKELIFQKSNVPQYKPPFFGELLFQSGQFFKRRYLLQQLPFQKSYFFLLFQNSHFFAEVIFSEQLFFRSENSTEQPVYDNYFSEQLFFSEDLFRTKISKKGLLFQSSYFCTALAFSEKLYLEKNDFSENQFPH